jgi:hypothetical protein
MEPRHARQLPAHTWSSLISYLHESGSTESPETVAALAIEGWIAQQQRKAAVGAACGPFGRGYQWKGLFLPSGTKLRMWHGHGHHYAEVEDDDIVFEGRRVSPAQMANSIAGNTRNAWREIWVLMPGESRWKLAALRRRQAQQLDERLALGPPAPLPPVAAGAFARAEPADGQYLRQLAQLLEQALSNRQAPVYRRRSDSLGDIGFD